MSASIFTSRLQLLPLDLHQLELALQNEDALEKSLDVPVMRSFITDRVHRVIGMKIQKMRKADLSQHYWITYWSMIIRAENVGAGMLGFKGFPNENGSTEIGYGMDAAYQNQGHMREAVRGLIDWAFTHPFCNIVTATEVENPASKRLLEKLGAELVSASVHYTPWKIRKYSVQPEK